MEAARLADVVRQTAYDIHFYLGHGFLERVYENALVNRLRRQGMEVRRQVPLQVFDEDGSVIGDYVADILVESVLLIEIKVARTLAREHEAQLLVYLKATKLRHGLLINFGSYRFEIRKFASPFLSSAL